MEIKTLACSHCGADHFCSMEIELFDGLEMSEHEMLSNRSIHRQYQKNEVLVRQEDAPEKIMIIRKGKVKLSTYSEDGKEYIYDIVEEGGIIGEQNLFTGAPLGMDVTSMSDVDICILTKETIEDLMMDQPQVGVQLVNSIGKKLEEARTVSRILSINDPLKRVAAFLVLRTQMFPHTDIEMTRETMASSINLSRETVSRKLNELADEGLVELIGYKKIKVTHLAALQSL